MSEALGTFVVFVMTKQGVHKVRQLAHSHWHAIELVWTSHRDEVSSRQDITVPNTKGQY
jgi:hypothetical protein